MSYLSNIRQKHITLSAVLLTCIISLRNQFGLLFYRPNRNTIKLYTPDHPSRLLYFNLNTDAPHDGHPIEMSKLKHNTVIAAVVSNDINEVEKLKNALTSLHHLRGDDDDAEFTAHVLVFNEGDLSNHQIQTLIECTRRPIAFPYVDLSSLPSGFNPDNIDAVQNKISREQALRSRLVNRFWLNTVWTHPAIGPYGVVMKVDPHSCFMEDNEHLPHPLISYSEYHSQYIGHHPSNEKISLDGLFNYTAEWLLRVKAASNPMMWQYVKTTWQQQGTLPIFRTGLEVFGEGYMKRNGIRKYVDDLTEREPFGVLSKGWNYQALRFMMAGIFFQNEMIVTTKAKGYGWEELCEKDKYDARFKRPR